MNARRFPTRSISALARLALVCLLACAGAWSASAATYYIDWTAGADSNNGTSTGTAWKRHPYMTGFTGSYSHTPGDTFKFKGGVTWPVACFQMRITSGGTDGLPDTYTSDTVWGTGRAVFDFEDASVGTGTSNYGIYITATAPYITFDNIDVKRHRGEAVYGSCAINVAFSGTGSVTFTNMLVRDWSLPTPLPVGTGAGNLGGGIWWTSGSGLVTVTHSELHQQNVAATSGRALQSVNVVQYSTIHHCGTGWTGGGTVRYNTFHTLGYNLADASAHLAAIKTFVVSDIYGNLLYNMSGECAPIELSSGYNSSSGTDRVYNNLIYNTATQPPIWLKTDRVSYSGLHLKVWNNTVVRAGGLCLSVYDGGAGVQLASAEVRNNHWITEGTAVSVTGVASYTYSNNLTNTVAVAEAAGYTSANLYQPTSGAAPTVDIGYDLSGSFTTDRLEHTRAAPFDAGCYEWDGLPSAGTLAFAAATYGTAEDTTLVVTVSRTGGTSGAVGATWTLADGTALAGTDYTAGSSTVSLGNGVSSATFNVTILRNVAYTGNRYFTATLTSPTGGAILGSPTVTTITITDSDPPPTAIPELDLSFGVAEMRAIAPFVVTDGVAQQSTTQYETNGMGELQAWVVFPEAGSYQLQLTNNSPNVGADSVWLRINGTNDVCDIVPLTVGTQERWANWRGNGTADAPQYQPMRWTFDAPSTNLVIVGGREPLELSGLLFVKMDDPPPVPQQLNFASDTAWTYNSSITAEIEVRRAGTDGTVTVDYATSNGTALAGRDYTTTSGTLTFVAGDVLETITVPVFDHSVYVGPRTFTVTLSNAVGADLANPIVCTVTIDDDLPQATQITIRINILRPGAIRSVTGSVTVSFNLVTEDGDGLITESGDQLITDL